MNAPIYYVGGSKGGVGKSKLAFALIDYLKEREQQILLLETDSAKRKRRKRKSAKQRCENGNGTGSDRQSHAGKNGNHTRKHRYQTRHSKGGVVNAPFTASCSKRPWGRWVGNWSPSGSSTGIGTPLSFCIPSNMSFPMRPSMCAAIFTSARRIVLTCSTIPKSGKRWNRPARFWIFPNWRAGSWMSSIPTRC